MVIMRKMKGVVWKRMEGVGWKRMEGFGWKRMEGGAFMTKITTYAPAFKSLKM